MLLFEDVRTHSRLLFKMITSSMLLSMMLSGWSVSLNAAYKFVCKLDCKLDCTCKDAFKKNMNLIVGVL